MAAGPASAYLHPHACGALLQPLGCTFSCTTTCLQAAIEQASGLKTDSECSWLRAPVGTHWCPCWIDGFVSLR